MTTAPTSGDRKSVYGLLFFWLVTTVVSSGFADGLWPRHTIDASMNGADGVRLADFDGDGRLDIVTGWEESGVVRLYLNPGPRDVIKPWPQVTVGIGASPEDAVPFDVDGDGRLDVISCHEGNLKQVMAHTYLGASASKDELLNPGNWVTSPIKRLDGQQWMFATPVDLRSGAKALVVGSKGKSATLTLLSSSVDQDEVINDWPYRKLRDCGWIMSILAIDMDADGDQDIVFSDRKSKHRAVAWLEQPDNSPGTDVWREHIVGATETEPLFIEATANRILVTTRQKELIEFKKEFGDTWNGTPIANPTDVPFGKAIRTLAPAVMIMTANTHADSASTKQPGVWLKHATNDWQPICDVMEAKFDRMELLDLDADGDLDVITCEERQLLGVVWYENPGIQ